MDVIQVFLQNLLSPAVLFFALGIAAAQLATIVPAFAQSAGTGSLKRLEPLKSIEAGSLSIGYFEAGPADGAPPPKPRKLTDASLKADRLRAFRAKDPTLDTAADALDLEIVD